MVGGADLGHEVAVAEVEVTPYVPLEDRHTMFVHTVSRNFNRVEFI